MMPEAIRQADEAEWSDRAIGNTSGAGMRRNGRDMDPMKKSSPSVPRHAAHQRKYAPLQDRHGQRARNRRLAIWVEGDYGTAS